MKRTFFLLAFICAGTTYMSAANVPERVSCDPWQDVRCELTETPTIGIVTQLMKPRHGTPGPTYIAASYAKWVESGGARPVPIWVHQNETYYRDILTKVNGILLPGGAASIIHGPYADASERIYRLVMEHNRNGTYFPLWGTCLGFEFLTYAETRADWLEPCSAHNESLNLDFLAESASSRMFGRAPHALINALMTENITANSHGQCFTPTAFQHSNMSNHYRALSVNFDRHHKQRRHVRNGTRKDDAASCFDTDKHVPVYATQFHPEKSNYEFVLRGFSHKSDAIWASQYLARFFVDEARKNRNHFESNKQLEDALIYNYEPVFTERQGSIFEQKYQFLWPNATAA